MPKILPDGIMGGVHADDILREREDSSGFLVFGHDGAQVRHGLAVVLGVCDCGERVGPAVILSDGNDVGPTLRVGVDAHCGRGQRFDMMLLEFDRVKYLCHVIKLGGGVYGLKS